MNSYQQKDEILLSWRRCIEKKLSPQQRLFGNNLKDKEITELLDKNKILISVFQEALDNIKSNNINKCLFLYYQMLTIPSWGYTEKKYYYLMQRNLL